MTETKTDIAKFISFRFKFFRFRFVFVFRNSFVSVFISVNGIKIFPLTDISVSVNANHTGFKNGGDIVVIVDVSLSKMCQILRRISC